MGRQGGTVRTILRRVALGLALTSLMACTALYRDHGYIPPEEDLSQIVVGVDTRDSVAELVGPPTSAGLLSDGGYYYIQSKFRHYGPMEPKEIERQVLAISFDANGVVSNIERFGLENGQVIVLSRRVTSDNVRDTTLIRQMLGALGNFDASTALGSP